MIQEIILFEFYCLSVETNVEINIKVSEKRIQLLSDSLII